MRIFFLLPLLFITTILCPVNKVNTIASISKPKSGYYLDGDAFWDDFKDELIIFVSKVSSMNSGEYEVIFSQDIHGKKSLVFRNNTSLANSISEDPDLQMILDALMLDDISYVGQIRITEQYIDIYVLTNNEFDIRFRYLINGTSEIEESDMRKIINDHWILLIAYKP